MDTLGLGDLLSPAQAARILEVTPLRVRQLMAEGKLNYVRTPIGRLVDPDSLQNLRRERAEKAAARAG